MTASGNVENKPKSDGARVQPDKKVNGMLTVKIFSVQKQTVVNDVTMVCLPGENGDLAILPGHQRLVAALRPGMMTIYRGKEVTEYQVPKALLHVTSGHCDILVTDPR